MSKLIYFLVILFPLQGFCSGQSVTFERLVKNLEVRVDAFVTSSDGGKVLMVDQSLSTFKPASQKPKMSTEWKSQFPDLPEVHLDAEVTIQTDLSLKVDIAQYKNIQWDKKAGKSKKEGLIRQESFTVKNFSPIVWVYKASADKNIVVRFIPLLPTQLEAEALTYPLMGVSDAIVTDNANRLWVQGVGGVGQILSFGSAYGTVYLSFTPFKNSKEIGIAHNDDIVVNLSAAQTLRVRSRETIVSGDVKAKVFGVFIPSKKHSSGSISAMNIDDVVRETQP